MKNKKWLLLLIIALPSTFWVILESSTINSKKLPHYGPKTAVSKGDTTYYSVKTALLNGDEEITTTKNPIVALMFVKQSYIKDSYRLAGLYEYLTYKNDKIKEIPVFLVVEKENESLPTKDSLKVYSEFNNVKFYDCPVQKFDSINRTFFKEKPIYIDYSFFVLLDENRHVRGYYDARYAAEIKRLIDEYRHLRLKEAKKQIIKDNQINKKQS